MDGRSLDLYPSGRPGRARPAVVWDATTQQEQTMVPPNRSDVRD
jgi:hypothetical protein